MARVLFELASGADAEIQLADNQFIEFWKMVFVRHKTRLNIRYRPNSENALDKNYTHKYFGEKVHFFKNANPEYYTTDSIIKQKQHHVNRINNAIDGLREQGIPWTRGNANIHSKFTALNKLHRGFTTLNFTRGITDHVPMEHDDLLRLKRRFYNMNYNNGWPLYFYDFVDINQYSKQGIDFKKENYTNDKDRNIKIKTIYEHLHEINAAIHDIENQCLFNPRKIIRNDLYIQHCDSQMQLQPILDWDAKSKDEITDALKLDWNFESGLIDAYNSVDGLVNQGYNVFDLKNILGKDYETCWIDHDNPYNFDITSTAGTTKGGFEIRPNFDKFYNQILRHWLYDDFNWDEHIAITHPIPIGKLDDKFIQEHFTIKGGIHNGEMVNGKVLEQEQTNEIMQTKHFVKVDLIE